MSKKFVQHWEINYFLSFNKEKMKLKVSFVSEKTTYDTLFGPLYICIHWSKSTYSIYYIVKIEFDFKVKF